MTSPPRSALFVSLPTPPSGNTPKTSPRTEVGSTAERVGLLAKVPSFAPLPPSSASSTPNGLRHRSIRQAQQ